MPDGDRLKTRNDMPADVPHAAIHSDPTPPEFVAGKSSAEFADSETPQKICGNLRNRRTKTVPKKIGGLPRIKMSHEQGMTVGKPAGFLLILLPPHGLVRLSRSSPLAFLVCGRETRLAPSDGQSVTTGRILPKVRTGRVVPAMTSPISRFSNVPTDLPSAGSTGCRSTPVSR